MDLDKVIFLLLDTIDMWQAISVGIFLLLMNRRKKNSLLLLGSFLVFSGLSSLSLIFDFFSAYVSSPYLQILSFNFLWLLPTLLYLYVERVSIEKGKKRSYYLLIPGGIDLLINIGKFFLPLHQKTALEESFGYALFELTGIVFGLVLIFKIFNKVRRHSKMIRNQYSSTENRDLGWLKVAIIAIITSFVFEMIVEFALPGFWPDLFMYLFSLFITFWIAYNGLLQQTSVNLINNQTAAVLPEQEDIIEPEPENVSKENEIVERIKNLLKNEKLYLNADLTIADIAKKIEEHPRTVSVSINRICQENFNRFINKYRIEEAKILLSNHKSDRLNMEGIGFEAGFNSNSSFYTAFKKELNITPLQFLKNSDS
ncbi:MAG: helix-turn-helix transcriptional regulator [Carboxylicivirga sp.]|jgi:AraC-like DNA-binding protein|nr:helix-turn-helix transcriptional regulator [Carboxylicivirga sp.]